MLFILSLVPLWEGKYPSYTLAGIVHRYTCTSYAGISPIEMIVCHHLNVQNVHISGADADLCNVY